MSLDASQNGLGWTSAGPVAAAYGESRSPIALCVGPTGGGKTTESVRRTIRAALWQHPSPRDGIRKARTIVLVPTYRRLWDQFIPSYRKVVGWSNKGWKGGTGEPAEHIYDFEHRDPLSGIVSRCHVEVLFRAPGDGDLEEFFRGLETTQFIYPEADTHETDALFSLGSNRVGRYPEPDDRPDDANLPPAYAGIAGDANAPVIGSWFHKRFFLEKRPGDRLFLQPPGYDPDSIDGFHPQAENVMNLRKISRSYYRDRALTHESWDVERLLRNRPGYSRHGQPVHPDFDAATMVTAASLTPDPDSVLVIGADAGSNTLNHAAVFLQRTWSGQVRGLGEVVPDGQSDIVEFATAIRRMVETRFKGVKRMVIMVDPAARGQSAMSRGISWAQMLQQMTGIEVQLAPTNDPRIRRTSVDQQLKRKAGPTEPGFIVSGPDCPKTAAAMAGGYRFKRTGDKVSPTPEKNDASHPADALQYGMLGVNGVGALEGRFIHPGGDEAHNGSLAAILPD